MDDRTNLSISRHAARRCGRRDMIGQLLDHADRETHVGGGAVALSISRRAAAAMGNPRFARYAAVITEGTLVTILPIHDGPAGRRYRRGVK